MALKGKRKSPRMRAGSDKTIVVTVSAGTLEWLQKLAFNMSRGPAAPTGTTVEELLAQAAFCFADAAGRRPGSWEAGVGREMLRSSGVIDF